MEVLLGLPPLHLVIRETAQKILARFSGQGFGPFAIKITKLWDVILAMPIDGRYQIEKNFETTLSNKSSCVNVGAGHQLPYNQWFYHLQR